MNRARTIQRFIDRHPPDPAMAAAREDALFSACWERGAEGGGCKVVPKRPRPISVAKRFSYGQAEQQFCDLRLSPSAAGPAPVAVFVHGGYWKSEWGLVRRPPSRRAALPHLRARGRQTGREGGC